jgi:CubicO group peptidase (beta-lactamase class C family)
MQYTGTNPELAQQMLACLAERRGGRGAAISAAVVMNGEVTAACVDGVRGSDSSPASLTDLFNIGSISKVYCAVAVMKLAELGKVDLDTPVIEYIPRFRMKDERYRQITLRMTLNHSSGMPGTNYHNAIADFWSGEHIMDENYEYWKHARLKADPGYCSVYCNDGFELAAAVVEAVSGRRYIDFLREAVLLPAGLTSTGEAEAAIDDRRMMSCIGQQPEWLTALGAGAIRSDIIDCARFGYLFVDPQHVMAEEYVAEIAGPQGVTFLKQDHMTPDYGFGWDSVHFSSPNISLGDTVLAKGGATSQFLSYLIVSPEYRLSAAISGTFDCRTDNPNLLCELIGIALEATGIKVSGKVQKEVPGKARPIPEEWKEQFSGIYYSGLGVFRVEAGREELRITRFAGGDKWTTLPMLAPMKWDGQRFFSQINSAVFEHHGGNDYLISRLRPERAEFVTLAQKNGSYPPLSRGWRDRIGERYIICNLNAYDAIGTQSPGIRVDSLFDDGVILFVFPPNPLKPMFPFSMGEYNALPAVSADDTATAMFLDAPGDGSRNIYAPETFFDNGREYLRCSGFIYINSKSVTQLESGPVTSDRGGWNPVFRIRQGTSLEFDKPDGVTVYMLNEELAPVYSSSLGQPLPPCCDGYVIFANTRPISFSLEVRDTV